MSIAYCLHGFIEFELISKRPSTSVSRAHPALPPPTTRKKQQPPSRVVAVLHVFFPSAVLVVVVMAVLHTCVLLYTCEKTHACNRQKKVCEHALLWALASRDLSFALRMCQHVDDEGMALDHDVRDAVFRAVGLAIKQLPDKAVVNVSAGAASAGTLADVAPAPPAPASAGAGGGEHAIGGGGGGEWKVEGTNATVEQLWELDALLQRYVCSRGRVCVCVCIDGQVWHIEFLLVCVDEMRGSLGLAVGELGKCAIYGFSTGRYMRVEIWRC